MGIFFADFFVVMANGRIYEANHDNYLDFLEQFRKTIHSIKYDLHQVISDAHHVVIPMTAHILRIEGPLENFEAIFAVNRI